MEVFKTGLLGSIATRTMETAKTRMRIVSTWLMNGLASTRRPVSDSPTRAAPLEIVPDLIEDVFQTPWTWIASKQPSTPWLEQALQATKGALDETAKGEAEGIVVRTRDRSRITKIRFEDYRRHARGKTKR